MCHIQTDETKDKDIQRKDKDIQRKNIYYIQKIGNDTSQNTIQ